MVEYPKVVRRWPSCSDSGMISLCAASPANGRPGAGRGIRKGVVPWAALGLEKKLYASGLDLFRRLHDVWLTLVDFGADAGRGGRFSVVGPDGVAVSLRV